MKKLIIRPDGIEEVDLTAEEIAQAETNDANSQSKLQQEETEKANAITKKTSGKQSKTIILERKRVFFVSKIRFVFFLPEITPPQK